MAQQQVADQFLQAALWRQRPAEPKPAPEEAIVYELFIRDAAPAAFTRFDPSRE